MQPRPTANYLPTEFLILVGKIAVQSAYADALLGEILGGLKDIKGTERAKTIHCLDTRRKIQDAKPLVESSLTEPERSALLVLLKRADELLLDRNLTVHGLICYADEDKSNSTPLYLVFRGKYVGQRIPFSKETLEPIFMDLDEICRELWAVCSRLGYSEFSP